MLEKMGWSKGKGLGAKLDGQLDFIKVSHKGDQKGVGFKDRDDQWTTHESNFNSLLSSFKSTENSDQEDQQSQDCAVQHFQSEEKTSKKEKDEKVELFSGVSLEEQSKNSRARVHYKKFTRGKDLARYSEKDLANIFGKKSLKKNAAADEPTAESAEDDKADEYNENTPNFGITTIETGTTIADYFKNKMKNLVNGSQKSSVEQVNNVESVSVSSNKKEKKNRKKSKTTEIESQDPEAGGINSEINKETASVAVHPDQTCISESKKRKHDSDIIEESKSGKKKKKKSIEQVVGTVDEESERQDDNETQSAESAPKKSKKNKKQTVGSSSVETEKATKNGNEVRAEEDCEIVNVEENHHSKKKSKKRNGVEESQSNNETFTGNYINDVDVEIVRPHKKSKKGRESKQTESCNNVPTGQPASNLFDYVAKVVDEQEQNVAEVVTDNVYEIRRYRTEIFRYVDLAAFPGSTLCDIPGYGYTNEITVKVVEKPNDNQLINTLWNDAQDKYANGGKQKKKKFVEHIGDLKKKNVFKI